jgi:hypothetical protein
MKLVSVYRANGEAEAYIIKGILEENGIPSVLSSDVSVGLIASGLGTIKVMVDEAKAAEARELIREQDNV